MVHYREYPFGELQRSDDEVITRHVIEYVTGCNLACNVTKITTSSSSPATRNAVSRCETGCEEGMLHEKIRLKPALKRRCATTCRKKLRCITAP